MGEAEIAYCLIDDIKDRVLIKLTDPTFDGSLELAVAEASRLVDIFLKPYTEVPLADVPSQIRYITADFGSSIFKRRYIPQEAKIRGSLQPDMINDQDGIGWFALGVRRIQDYIKSYYALAQEPSADGVVINPSTYMQLFKQGILTLLEARELMNNGNAINEILSQITTIDLSKTIDEKATLDRTETIASEINKVLQDVRTITITETRTLTDTKTRTDTATETLNRGETLTKTQSDAITVKKGETLSTEETKTLSQKDIIDKTATEVAERKLTESEERTTKLSDDKTISREETKNVMYPTKKQHSFAFIQSDENGGYKEQED